MGPAVGHDPTWYIQYSPSLSSTLMLQLCTAPTDGNLIPGYLPQTSHPLLAVPITEWQIQPRNKLISRGNGFEKGLSLPSGMETGDCSLAGAFFFLPFSLLYLSDQCHVAWCTVPCPCIMLKVPTFNPDVRGFTFLLMSQHLKLFLFSEWRNACLCY